MAQADEPPVGAVPASDGVFVWLQVAVLYVALMAWLFFMVFVWHPIEDWLWPHPAERLHPEDDLR